MADLYVVIHAVSHEKQRYPTAGDWRTMHPDWSDSLKITVSRMPDWRYEALVAFHELAEALICRHKGVSQSDVDAFDMAFEKNRKAGDESEPGDDPKAPYKNAHQFATIVERMLAEQLEVNWDAYESAIENLG